MSKPETLTTRVSTLFGIRYPIFSAPMFLVSNETMVLATARAGGLGCFPALNFRPISRYIEALKTLSGSGAGPFGVNIIVNESNRFQDEQIENAIEMNTPLIISSLGNPAKLIRRCEGTKTKVFCDVVNLEHAKKAAGAGAHGLIAVGSGAGGHSGELSLFALIPFLKKHIEIPILAAGSITNGATMAAAFALGAEGVYLGTRFIASKESPVDEAYKQAILKARPEDIVNTDRVDGFPGNFIKTKQLEKYALKEPLWESAIKRIPGVKKNLSLLRAAKSLLGSQTKNPLSYKNVYSAGHGVGLIETVPRIDEIIDSMVREYFDVRSTMPS